MIQLNSVGSRGGGFQQAAVAAAVGVTLAGGGSAMAGLVAHYDAAVGVYTNNETLDGVGGLAADGQAVREWHDQAALGGNQLAQQGNETIQPSYQANAINGLPAIHFGVNPIPGNNNPNGLLMGNGFDGADQTDVLNTQTISWTMVFQNPSPDDNRTLLAAQYTGDGGHSSFWRMYYEGGYRISHGRRTGGTTSLAGTFTDANNPGDGHLDWMIVTAVWDGENGVFTEYVNGVQTGQITDAFNESAAEDIVFDRYRIGANAGGSVGSRFEGLVAELLIWNHAISDVERVSTEVGLGQKYGLAVVPEPASLALLASGAITAMSRRRA